MGIARTSRRKWVCPLCGYTWVTEGAINVHLAKPHKTCPTCGAQRVGLKQHISHAHSGTRRPK